MRIPFNNHNSNEAERETKKRHYIDYRPLQQLVLTFTGNRSRRRCVPDENWGKSDISLRMAILASVSAQ